MAEITGITLVALFLLWTCGEGSLAGEMSFEALLGAGIAAILPRLSGIGFENIQTIAYCLDSSHNFRLRELLICTKICTKASAFVLLPFCYRSALVLLSFRKSLFCRH